MTSDAKERGRRERRGEKWKRLFEARRSFERRFAPVSCNRNQSPLRRSQSPSHDRSVTDGARRISHLRANLINNGIAAYVLTNGQTGCDLRRGKCRIDRRADQSGTNFDRDHVALYLKRIPLKAREVIWKNNKEKAVPTTFNLLQGLV